MPFLLITSRTNSFILCSRARQRNQFQSKIKMRDNEFAVNAYVLSFVYFILFRLDRMALLERRHAFLSDGTK